LEGRHGRRQGGGDGISCGDLSGLRMDHLKGQTIGRRDHPRLGGQFFWHQFNAAADMASIWRMSQCLIEVDEGTAIFKVTNNPPTQAHFQTFENLPSTGICV